MDRKEKWLAKMVERYGSLEAVSLEMSQRQLKSRQNPKSKEGGFRYLKKTDPDKLKEISARGVDAREKKAAKDQNQAQSQDNA